MDINVRRQKYLVKGSQHSPETRAKMKVSAASKKHHGLSGTEHYWRYMCYRITPDTYNRMLREQDNRCAVCLYEFTDDNPPVVDHDHSCCPFIGQKTCGKCVRGLTHESCNAAIGLLCDDPERLQRAASYVINHQARRRVELESIPTATPYLPGITAPLTSAIH